MSDVSKPSDKPTKTRKIEGASIQERAPYISAGLGRPLSKESHNNLLSRFARVEKLKPVLHTGLVYIPGSALTNRIRYGYVAPDKPNLTPQQVIAVINVNLHKSNMLPESADERLEVPVKGFRAKKWGEDGLKLEAIIGSDAGEESPWKQQVLSESKAAIDFARKMNFYSVSQEVAVVNQAIPLAVGEWALAEAVKAQIEFNAESSNITVDLTRIGFVDTPFTL